MKPAICLLLLTGLAVGAEKKTPVANGGNDNIEITATPLADREEIRQALGADLGPGFVVVRVRVEPKTENPMRVSPDDFELLSHKDGQRSGAFAPSQIAGKAALVVASGSRGGGGLMSNSTGPIWGGLGGDRPRKMGGDGGGIGNTSAESSTEVRAQANEKAKDNPLLELLKQKVFPDKETKEPVAGLLYFQIEGKLKAKDLALIYKGPGGRLVVEFSK